MLTPEQVAQNFAGKSGSVDTVEKHGRGIIHDTYLVKLEGEAGSFILQRINTRVFKQPELIMHNLRLVCEHMHDLKKNSRRIDLDWQMPDIVPARDNRDFFIDPEGGFWRALSFISGAYPLETISSPDNAREVGRALGIFHQQTSTLNPGLLHDTLPEFHNIEHYLHCYDQVAPTDITHDVNELEQYFSKFIENRRSWAPVLENGRKQNKLQLRIIHGDPKMNNVMIDNRTGKAVSIIDLDTVKPGLVLYDLGDFLRSTCNISGEEVNQFDAVTFDLELCEASLSGYMEEAGGCLTQHDFVYAFDAIKLLPFELGLRFYTDYLEGNHYFKVSHLAQNLDRAMVQFRLVESIEQQKVLILELLETFHGNYLKV